MTSLASLLEDHRDEICRMLRLVGESCWEKRIPTLGVRSPGGSGNFNDEATWTFLAACGYAICEAQGISKFTAVLTGRSDLKPPEDSKIWLEFRPMTPRKGESRTRLDLAIGTITRDAGTKGGIKLGLSDFSTSWICFCEMKWESDISAGVTNDPARNQLVRVIESALYFQRNGDFADEVHVALVTPAVFRDKPLVFKNYPGKFRSYERDNANILEDLRNCILEPRGNFDAAQRIDALQLHWRTFDELFASIPESVISDALQAFHQNYGAYLNRG